MEVTVSELGELINGRSVAKPAVDAESSPAEVNWGPRIVILQRGWIIVGNVTKRGAMFTVTEARVIRNWGTTNGIGEIALNGPTASTKLDKCGTVTFHEHNEVAQIECQGDKWKAVLS